MDSSREKSAFPNDRRRRARVGGETAGWVLPDSYKIARHAPGDDEAWEVRIQNVSRYGAGFISTQAFDIGNEIDLRIGLGPVSRARLGRIVYCQPLATNGFHIGVEFVDLAGRELKKAG